MIKILLVIIVVGGFLYVGFGVSNYYKKEMSFSGLILLCDKLRADIDFSGKNLTAIFQNIDLDGNLKKLSSNFCEYLKNKDVEFSTKQLFRGIWILKDEEKTLYLIFFKAWAT